MTIDPDRRETVALAIALAASVALHIVALALGGTVRHAHELEPPRVLSVVLPEPEAPARSEPIAPPAPASQAETAHPKAKPVVPAPSQPEHRREEDRPILPAPEPSASAAPIAPAPAAAVPDAESSTPAAPAARPAAEPGGTGEAVVPPSYRAAYLQNPPPRYPATARRNGEEGTVLLRVLVTAEGRAGRIELDRSSGSPVLDAAATEAVQRWRFVPARRGGDAVEAWVVVPLVFRLEPGN